MVHTLVSFDTVVTESPDDAVGDTDTAASPYVFAESDANVMVWLATFTAKATASEVTDDTAAPAPKFRTTTRYVPASPTTGEATV
jgi:hypothetical protein